jgi:hypothetical protein
MDTRKKSIQEKQWKPPVKKDKLRERKSTYLSLSNMKACHIIGTALMESIANIGIQSTMKSSVKTLQEFSPHTPQKTLEREHTHTPPQKSGHDFASKEIKMRRFY